MSHPLPSFRSLPGSAPSDTSFGGESEKFKNKIIRETTAMDYEIIQVTGNQSNLIPII